MILMSFLHLSLHAVPYLNMKNIYKNAVEEEKLGIIILHVCSAHALDDLTYLPHRVLLLSL